MCRSDQTHMDLPAAGSLVEADPEVVVEDVLGAVAAEAFVA